MLGLQRRLAARFSSLTDVFRSPQLRWLQLAWGGFYVSEWASFMMLSMSSDTDWMKQADPWGYLYALSARAHRLISRAGIVLLIAGGVLAHGVHLIVFGILWAIIGPRHPPVLGDTQSLGPGRILVALIALVIFILCVIPQSPGLS